MSDPLHDALVQATLAVLIGQTGVPTQTVDSNGYVMLGTVTIGSAFESRLRDKAMQGEFDDLLRQAMEQVEPAAVARAIEGLLAEAFIAGLKNERNYYTNSQPNWLQAKAKDIAVEAAKAALAEDEALKDRLRGMIGSEVDRNRVGITVSLSDPEKG